MAFENEQWNKRRELREKQRKSYNRQMKWMKIGLIVTICVAVLCGGVLIAANQGWLTSLFTPQAPSVVDPEQTETTPPETQPVTPDTVIHLMAAGDLNVTDRVIAAGQQGTGYDFSGAFRDVMPLFAQADLSMLNFEGNLSVEPYGSQSGSAPQALMEALRNMGVDLIQTANSRALNNGLLGLRQTITGIDAAGMQSVGTFADAAAFEKQEGFVIRQVQGIRIAFVAFTKGMDGRGLPEGSEHCVNLLYKDYNSTYQTVDTEGITKVLRAAREQKPDLVVALLHWGSEYNDQISSTQKKIITLMADEGVDAIIGTHSHYVQKMGFDPETGMFIAYSLGDFFGDGEKAGTNYSVLLDLEITKDGKTGKVRISGFDYTPVFLCEDKHGDLHILRIREAMLAYESNNINKISKEVYSQMQYALGRIEARVNGT